MIDFIIVDDNCIWLQQISSIIDKIMIKTNFEYNKKGFTEYDDSFYKYIEQELENKIYILDIETNKNNGIDVARNIRRKDTEATIIFLTAYKDYGNKVLTSMIEAFCFIYKNDNVEEILEQNIIEILNRIIENDAVVKIKDACSFYAIPLSKILYITTDTQSRKIIIKTEMQDIYCKKTLISFEEEYQNNLIRTHKSCVVNVKKVIDFDFKNSKIHFNNRKKIELLSKKYKDKIKEKFFSE